MNGREVFKHAVKRFPEVIIEALDHNKLSIKGVTSYSNDIPTDTPLNKVLRANSNFLVSDNAYVGRLGNVLINMINQYGYIYYFKQIAFCYDYNKNIIYKLKFIHLSSPQLISINFLRHYL